MKTDSDAGVTTERRDEVLVITIDRPKANAISASTSHALYRAFSRLDFEDDVRAGVLTAAGDRFFCAGWDLKAAAQGEAHDADHGPGGFAGITKLFEFRKPIIAAVNGSAYGGGVELMLAAHLVVAASRRALRLSGGEAGHSARRRGDQPAACAALATVGARTASHRP